MYSRHEFISNIYHVSRPQFYLFFRNSIFYIQLLLLLSTTASHTKTTFEKYFQFCKTWNMPELSTQVFRNIFSDNKKITNWNDNSSNNRNFSRYFQNKTFQHESNVKGEIWRLCLIILHFALASKDHCIPIVKSQGTMPSNQLLWVSVTF